MTFKLNWERNPELDFWKAKTRYGVYTSMRTHNDISKLYFDDDLLRSGSDGGHTTNRKLAEIHYGALNQADTVTRARIKAAKSHQD